MQSIPASIEIINSINQILYSEDVLITNGELKIEIDATSFLKAGMYEVHVIAGASIYMGKVIIQQ